MITKIKNIIFNSKQWIVLDPTWVVIQQGRKNHKIYKACNFYIFQMADSEKLDVDSIIARLLEGIVHQLNPSFRFL